MSRCFVIYTNEKRFYNPDGNETMNRRTILVQEAGTDNYYKIYIYKRFDWNPTLISSHLAPVKNDMESIPFKDNTMNLDQDNGVSPEKYRELLRIRSKEREK